MSNVPTPNAKRTTPTIPVGHPEYVWRGAVDTDVQRTWRRFGWTPISAKKSDDKQS